MGVAGPDWPVFDFLALENQLRELTAQLQPSLNMVRQCNGNVSDHFPFAQIHIPAMMYLEAGNNPFRDEGGDTVGSLDLVYFDKIARVGIPFIAEAEWPSAYSSLDDVSELGTDYLLRSVRLCAELGADVVKTNWPGTEEEFAQLVEAATGLPVVLAGGSRITDEELLTRQEAAMRAGAVGCSVGRNIFMHERPEAITRALHRVIADRWPAAQALEELTGAPV